MMATSFYAWSYEKPLEFYETQAHLKHKDYHDRNWHSLLSLVPAAAGMHIDLAC